MESDTAPSILFPGVVFDWAGTAGVAEFVGSAGRVEGVAEGAPGGCIGGEGVRGDDWTSPCIALGFSAVKSLVLSCLGLGFSSSFSSSLIFSLEDTFSSAAFFLCSRSLIFFSNLMSSSLLSRVTRSHFGELVP